MEAGDISHLVVAVDNPDLPDFASSMDADVNVNYLSHFTDDEKAVLAKKKKAVLVLGHGRFYGDSDFRCSPLPKEEIVPLMRCEENNTLTMVNDCEDILPDVLVDVRTEGWHRELDDHGKFDLIIETISPLAYEVRQSIHYWKGLYELMSKDGKFVGWVRSRPSRDSETLTRQDIGTRIENFKDYKRPTDSDSSSSSSPTASA